MQTTFGPQPPWETRPSPALGGGAVPSEPPVNRLALAAFACSLLGVAPLPIIGGLVGAGLGAAALARMRPGESGRGLARAAVVMGLVLSVAPLFAFSLLDDHLSRSGVAGSLPAVAVFTYGVAVATFSFREPRRREQAGVASRALGGRAAQVATGLLALGASWAFVSGIRTVVLSTRPQVRCTVIQIAEPDPACSKLVTP